MPLTITIRIKLLFLLCFVIYFQVSGQTEYKFFPPNDSVEYFGDYTSSNGNQLAVSSFINTVNIYTINNNSIELDTIIVTKETGNRANRKFYIDEENLVCAGYNGADSSSISFYKKDNNKWNLVYSNSFFSRNTDFGRGFCVTDNYAFVSCNYFNYDNNYQLQNDSSKIFVFRKIGYKWETNGFIYGSINSKYGIAIDCDDSTLFVGSERHLYFYSLENNRWMLKKQVESDVRDISISNNYVAIANPLKYISIYKKEISGWELFQRITPHDSIDFSYYGHSVELSGSFLIFGCNYNGPYAGKGCAFIFENNGNEWLQVAKLENTGTYASDNFVGFNYGINLTINKNLLFIGQSDDHEIADFSGAVFVYNLDSLERNSIYNINNPTNLLHVESGASSITLKWDDNSKNEKAYIIERCRNGLFEDSFEIYTLDANVTTFINSGLIAQQTYFYRVKAVNDYYDSDYSNIVSLIAPGTLSDISTIKNNGIDVDIYPNPTTALLNINCEKPINIEICNIHGVVMHRERLKSGHNNIYLDRLSADVYILKLYDENTYSITRFVKK